MLTKDMTRLSNEIATLRQQRTDLIQQLAEGNGQRHKAVSRLCAHMRKATHTAAMAAKHKRLKDLHDLKSEVSAIRHSMSADLAGVRRAWSGSAV